MNVRLAIRFALFLICILFHPISIAAQPSANIPFDSWIYSDLEKLAGLGLIDSALQGSRPYTRQEATRQLTEARHHFDNHQYQVARELVARLEGEFAVELSEREDQGPSYWKPVRNLQFKFIHQNGEPTFYPGTSAVQFPLNTNNFGIEYEDGNHLQMTFESEGQLARHLLLSIRPLALFNEDGESELRLLSGKIALALGEFEISIGRQSLWWGQGRHGSLLLTNNAKPLDMLRITNPRPQLLPWIFHYLGPFRFDLFWSELDNYIANPTTGRGNEPYFGGLRFNFKPLPWLEFGASRTVLFGGKDVDINTSDFITILGGENLSGNEDTSNSLGAIDLRLKLPFLWDAELYGELAGEDQAESLGFIPYPSKKSWLAGLYLPRIETSGRFSIRLEHADLRTMGSNPNVLYRHSLYSSGYTYENKILGHHAGPAAKDTYAELEISLSRKINLAFFLSYQERGYDQPLKEKHLQPGLKAAWFPHDHLSLDFYYAMDHVDNFRYTAGEDRDLTFLRLAVSGRW